MGQKIREILATVGCEIYIMLLWSKKTFMEPKSAITLIALLHILKFDSEMI